MNQEKKIPWSEKPYLIKKIILSMQYCANHIFKNCSTQTVVVNTIYVIAFSLTFRCQAQDTAVAQATRQEVWPEIDAFYRFNDKFRLFAFVSGTQLKSSSYTDGGLAVNLDYFALPIWRKARTYADSARGNLLWLRGGFFYSSSPKNTTDGFKEYTIVTEANTRFFLPLELLLTNKNRIDWRFLNGDFQPRYRPRITVERDLKTDFLTFNAYFYAEYFLNFKNNGSNRLRLALGTELRVAKHINFEVYFVHQFDNGLDIVTVNAVGLALKIYWQQGDHLFSKNKDTENKN
jgi:hypothetical protein